MTPHLKRLVLSTLMAACACPLAATEPNRVSVQIRTSPDREAKLLTALEHERWIEVTASSTAARLEVTWQGEQLRIADASRTAMLTTLDADESASFIARIAARTLAIDRLLELDHPEGDLLLQARLLPAAAPPQSRGIIVTPASTHGQYRIRRDGEPRSASNSLQLEVQTNVDAWITVVNIDSADNVTLLFPNVLSERSGYFPDGHLPAGRAHLLPDALQANVAGFHWDIALPAGVDTLRVFAASTPQLGAELRSHIGDLATRAVATQRAAPAFPQRSPDSLRGSDADWAAVTLRYTVAE